MKYYILTDDHEIIEKPDFFEWANWFEKNYEHSLRIVKQETVWIWFFPKFVSTVFLGIDHNLFSEEVPILFETMVFDNAGNDELTNRYATWEEAQKGHQEIVRYLKRKRWRPFCKFQPTKESTH